MSFVLEGSDGKKHSLDSYKGKFLVLYFYPKDNTPGCTIEAKEFSMLKDEFNKLGAEILGVSKDSIESHKRFIEKHNLKITLLSDSSLEVMKKYKAYGKKKNYGREYFGVIRSTILFDKSGKIIKEWHNVKARGHAEKVLKFLKEFIKNNK